jgi:hypothetical protein
VVSEGRRVLGNIERTSNLYLTKTVYAMLLSLAVGVAGTVAVVQLPPLVRRVAVAGACAAVAACVGVTFYAVV